ncbi:MAG: acylneuraminate cytidylyltransferase [Spirochaetaceae bacterium]|nr:MAG: acylneuraminate cytidylyltransferase [Spirochaetaceae bacterium]
MHSHRLPRKALIQLQGLSVLSHVLRALKQIPVAVRALLTDDRSVEALAPIAGEEGFSVFVGPEEDVLARYARAVGHYGVRRIIRATGDNPLVSARAAQTLLGIHQRENYALSHFLNNPLGTGVEVVEAWALLEAAERAQDPHEREHITTFLYRHADSYRVGEIPCPDDWAFPEARVTLDTEADYALLKELFAELYDGRPIEIDDVVDWLKRNTLSRIAPTGQE